jgi:hypothetical protein
MCIAIVTTEHPQYPFILLNNRDVSDPIFLTFNFFANPQPRNISIGPHRKQPGGQLPTNTFLEAMIFTDQYMAPGSESHVKGVSQS